MSSVSFGVVNLFEKCFIGDVFTAIYNSTEKYISFTTVSLNFVYLEGIDYKRAKRQKKKKKLENLSSSHGLF